MIKNFVAITLLATSLTAFASDPIKAFQYGDVLHINKTLKRIKGDDRVQIQKGRQIEFESLEMNDGDCMIRNREGNDFLGDISEGTELGITSHEGNFFGLVNSDLSQRYVMICSRGPNENLILSPQRIQEILGSTTTFIRK